jgi:hypothetical protein
MAAAGNAYHIEYVDPVSNLHDYECQTLERIQTEFKEMSFIVPNSIIQIIIDYSKSWKQSFEYAKKWVSKNDFNDIFDILVMFKNIAPIRQSVSEYLYQTHEDIWKQTAFWKEHNVHESLYLACEQFTGSMDLCIRDIEKKENKHKNEVTCLSYVTTQNFQNAGGKYAYRTTIGSALAIDFLVLRLAVRLDQDESVFNEVQLRIGGTTIQIIQSLEFLNFMLRMYGYKIHKTRVSDFQIIEIPLPFDFILSTHQDGMPRNQFQLHEVAIELTSKIRLHAYPQLVIRYLCKRTINHHNTSYHHIILQSQFKNSKRGKEETTMTAELNFSHPTTILNFLFKNQSGIVIKDNNLIVNIKIHLHGFHGECDMKDGWICIHDFSGIYSVSFASENPTQSWSCGSLNFSRTAQCFIEIKLNNKNPNYKKIKSIYFCGINRNVVTIRDDMCGLMYVA